MKIDNVKISQIEKILNNKKIINSKLLSNSFGIDCIKITLENNNNFIVKYYHNKNFKFNAIKSESKNLLFLNKSNLKFFPKIFSNSENFLIMSFIENDGLQPSETKNDFLNAVVTMHSLSSKYYGFKFDTQIGGLKQININNDNWVEFYKNYRLGYIYDLINYSQPMERSINLKIDLLINKLEDFIPANPKPSLLHGDLWEGNILFNKKKFVGFIDPGSFYGHNELEIAYLKWFNPMFIKNQFLEKYNSYINIDKEYLNYEPIYQLYYSLLNVHLWDRSYLADVKRLLNKIKI